jgi:hypothetical protein
LDGAMNKRRSIRKEERGREKREGYWRRAVGQRGESRLSTQAFRKEKTAVYWMGREERYRLSESAAVRVEAEMESGGERSSLEVELLDISPGGMRLRSKTPVAENAFLTISIVPQGSSRSLSTRARACWMTLAPRGRYWLGCSIEPKIPQALFDHLATKGILERRQDARQEVCMTVPACWELDPARFEASILNVSRGGICLSIAQDGSPGDRIRLTLPGDQERPTYVVTTVFWQVATEDGFIVGCSFSDQTGYERFIQVAGGRRGVATAASNFI